MKNESILFESALRHYEKKDYTTAHNIIDKILDANPDFYKGWFLKGVIFKETGVMNKISDCFNKTFNIHELWFRLALQIENIDPERAIACYRETIQIDPKFNVAWYKMGLIFERLGILDEARKCFSNLSPLRDVFSKFVIPLAFCTGLFISGYVMIRRGEVPLSLLVTMSAMFCLFWLKHDGLTAVGMLKKKMSAGKN